MDAGIDPSVGTVGDSYDDALAESIIGLFKTEVTKLLSPWKSMSQLEWETLKWVDWYNTKRLHSAIGYITPYEAEEIFYETLNANNKAAQHLNQTLSGKPRAVQWTYTIPLGTYFVCPTG
jgi:putative transposase